MVKRKEVKIDEEQIRRVMAGDIPDAVLKNICDDNDTGSPKEDGKEAETESRAGIPAEPDEVKDTGTSTGEDASSPGLREKHAGKGTPFRSIPNICSATTL